MIRDNFGSGNRNGILLNDGSSGNLIEENIIVENYYNNLALVGSSNNDILNNDFSRSPGVLGVDAGAGIVIVWGSSDNLIQENIINDNDRIGVTLQLNSNKNILDNNNINLNSYGVYLDRSSNNNLTENKISSNTYGVYMVFSNSNNNLIKENKISSNSYGVYFISSTSNDIIENNLSSNNYGIYLYAAGGNNLRGNSLASKYSGISLKSSSNIEITNNLVCGSSSNDFYCDEYSVGVSGGGNNLTKVIACSENSWPTLGVNYEEC